MAPRVSVSIFVSAAILIPIAMFFHSDSSYKEQTDSLDAAILQDLVEDTDVSVSLLQKSSTVHSAALSAKNIQNTIQNTTADVDSLSEMEAAAVDIRAALAEYLAMAVFVIIGCGSAMGIAKTEGSAWILQVSLTFGIAITVLAYSIGSISGGQINCAVTFTLALTGNLSWVQALVNFIFQILGSITGALFLVAIYQPADRDLTRSLASNGVTPGWNRYSALVGEIVGTFLLCFTVLETAKSPATAANRPMDAIAIGFSVFLAHSVLVPIDGCSINPTRSFGPALVSAVSGRGSEKGSSWDSFTNHWIFWVGPLLGAALAALIYQGFGAAVVEKTAIKPQL
jgi:MIP family channel proteins